MKKKSGIKKIWMLSLVFVMTIASTVIAVAAGTGRLELLLQYQNVRFSLYKVGNYSIENGNRKAELTDSFKNAGVDLSTLWSDASEIRREAEILETYVGQNSPAVYAGVDVSPYSEAGTSLAGKAVVENLDDGIYLVIKSGGDSRIEVTPFIVTMPYLDVDSQTWSYLVTAHPKCSYDRDTGGDTDGGRGSRDRTPRTSSLTNIPDADVPLTSWIPDQPVPLAGLPKMGDFGFMAYLLGALAAAAAGTAAFRRRKKYEQYEE